MFLNKKSFKIVSLVFVLFMVGIFYPCVTNADVQETYIDFSDVEIGATGTRILHISNLTRYSLSVELQFGTCSCGTPFSVATPSLDIAAYTTASVEVYFKPLALGPCSTILYIFSGNNGVEALEVVGTGIEATTQPQQTSDTPSLLVYFDQAVDRNDLEGSGPGKSADNRLKALRSMIRIADRLIRNGDIDGACGKLRAIYKKIDGQPKPQDFVAIESPGLEGLQEEVRLSMEGIGCQ